MSRRWSTMLAAASGVCGMICLPGLGSALAADTFDGVYTGRRAVEKGAGPRCEGSDVTVVIKGETLRFTVGHRPSVLMGFLSRPDGSFSQLSAGGIRGPAVMIKGRIVGDVLDADVSNEPCAFHWHLTKKPRGE